MNALREENIKNEAFYQFICDHFNSNDFTVFALAGDASNRRYFRVVHNEKSYVLMVWEPFKDDGSYPFLSVLEHFAAAAVHVPKVLTKLPAEGFILLEDLGDLTLERRFWETANQNDALPYYKLAIDELIKIHINASENKTNCTAFKVSFDTEKLMWEMNYANKHFLVDFLALSLTKAEQQVLESCYIDICSHLAEQRQVICHRDYHARNLMFKLGKIYVIDFQDARLGPIQYDLVSLLKDSYVQLSTKSQETLLQYYFDQWHIRKQEDLNTSEFFATYDIQTIQRCFKACGSFTSFYNTREDLRYLKYVRPTTTKFLDALSASGKYNNAYDILKDKIESNKKYSEL